MRITFISDTHTKHNETTQDLPGGDLLIHSGDFMNSGYGIDDALDFCKWFDGLKGYTHKIFIAGNHDRLFENLPDKAMEIVNLFKNITYLQDTSVEIDEVKIYGSPWQPAFYDWAFNLPRNGVELEEKWKIIPNDVDILITHGPPWGHCDSNRNVNLGCDLLRVRVDKIKPKIHIFGHIHSGSGYKFWDGTHFINAAVLNERYNYENKPITMDWTPHTNEYKWV